VSTRSSRTSTRTTSADSAPRDAALQRRYFEEADPERFHWTTSAPGFVETEDELLAPFLGVVDGPCLEIGCGEGNNLVRLARRARCVGSDLFVEKLRFAAGVVPGACFAAGDAAALPFRDASFRTVFVRDLLHHVPEPARVLAEAVRVLAPGGRLCILEPNGRNPLVRLQTHLVAAEAGARDSGVARLDALLSGLPLTRVTVRTLQPLPLRRMVLHYRFGLPVLGRISTTRRALAVLERMAGGLLPRSRWAYATATAERVA
jgi:ubiquinone/menaquinone biosynthesis C-methylase UbiE